jgi:hypothetical protein
MEPMKPMKPMEPMEPMSRAEKWWPDELGEPTSSGSQNGMRYAFFPRARRLLIEQAGKLTTYDSADHQINGVQSSASRVPVFTTDNGAVDLAELEKVGSK